VSVIGHISVRIFLSLAARYAVLAAFLVGGIATLGLPPLYLVPLLILAVWFLYAQIGAAPSLRRAALLAYAWHLGYFIFGLYWIGFALLVDAAQFAWALPLAMLGLPLVLAVYGALLGAVFFWLRRKYLIQSPIWAGVIFALLWVLAEWLRGMLFSGFPWNLVGYGWAFADITAQAAALIGIFGLSLLVVLLAVSIEWWRQKQIRAAAVVLGAVLLSLVYGFFRLPPGQSPMQPGVQLRLVQPNIEQKLKWDKQQVARNLQQLLSLSAQPAQIPVTHIIWPETAVPYPVDRARAPRRLLGAVTPPRGALIFGAPRGEYDGQGDLQQIFNSLIAIDRDADIIAEYDKFHLVPFGEYLPLPDWLGLRKITPGSMDYSPGRGPQTIILPNLPPFSPLICYEIIFANRVTDGTNRAEWILNITNDGWYGETAGPHQHLAMARIRAVETGLPVVRVANTGISAVFDGYGREVARLGLGRAGFLDTGLPLPAYH
jgi:apolipoprotein N-acyltransferase